MKSNPTLLLSACFLLLWVALANRASAEDTPPGPMILETWACSYKEGKDLEDKLKARDYLVAQLNKAGLKKTPAYHWTQIKGMAPVDTVWFDVHQNIVAFGEASDAFDASGIGPGVGAQFEKVEECTAGLSTMQIFHQREGETSDDNNSDDAALVVNLACNFKHGRGYGNLPDLTGHMGQVMGSFGADGPTMAAERRPVTSGPNYPDLFLFSVFEDMSHWSRYVMKLFNTDAGQSMRNHMDMITDCHISMWEASMVVRP